MIAEPLETRRDRIKTSGFGHAPERDPHHFLVTLPRGPSGDAMVHEVFHEDAAGPALEAANLRAILDLSRWLKIADALEEDFNRRLRVADMRPGRWKPGINPVARLLGKELVLLAWAIEDADPSLIPAAVQNWRGLAPEERWWLYTMTAAQTGHHAKRNTGWRKAVRYALTENPVFAAPEGPTTAERRARQRPPPADRDRQSDFFRAESTEQPPYAARIWEST